MLRLHDCHYMTVISSNRFSYRHKRLSVTDDDFAILAEIIMRLYKV